MRYLNFHIGGQPRSVSIAPKLMKQLLGFTGCSAFIFHLVDLFWKELSCSANVLTQILEVIELSRDIL